MEDKLTPAGWREAKCSVTTPKGKVYCPDPPVHQFQDGGKTIYLCERCYEAVNYGAYGEELQALAKACLKVVRG